MRTVRRWTVIVLLAGLGPACGGSGGGSVPQAGFGITSSSLPVATQGTAYSTTLQASGGTLPYVWSVSSGVLPAGRDANTGSFPMRLWRP